MGRPLNPLERLGRTVAEGLDDAARDIDAVAQVRARIVAPDPRETSLKPEGAPAAARLLSRAQLAALTVGALAAAAGVALVVAPRRARPVASTVAPNASAPLTYTVGDRAAVPWLASSAEAMPVTFSDGTRIVLDPRSSARVFTVDANGAEFVLESGGANVSVVHREGARWLLHAGPYLVEVTGTRFAISWDPSAQRLAIGMEEGRVRVSGCGLESKSVSAGEHLDRVCNTAEGAVVAPVESNQGPGTPAASQPSARQPAAPPPTEPLSWQRLAASGRYVEAFDAADAAGIDSISETATAPELLALADAARFSRHTAAAVKVLETIRRRFPGGGAAATAAFHLGRVAFDQQGAYASAASWFEVYGREQPGGPFAREAAGRLVEARQRSGDVEGARAAAQSYLVSFPDGPHAALARSLAQR